MEKDNIRDDELEVEEFYEMIPDQPMPPVEPYPGKEYSEDAEQFMEYLRQIEH
jgi:hypothetical protein